MIERVLNDFDIDQIANSGQCFRFHRVGDKSYNLIAGTHLLNIQQNGRTVRFDCDEDEFNAIWRPYFDLDADYGRCKAAVAKRDTYLAERRCIRRWTAYSAAGPVGRLFYALSSPNRTISRGLPSVSENLCSLFGKPVIIRVNRYTIAFPTAERLAACTPEDLAPVRLGYRAKYICAAARQVASGAVDLEAVRHMDYAHAKAELLRLTGVGIKVAECICLFALHHIDAFPVDTHIRQMLDAHYPKGFPLKRYKGFAGVMQQYAFYYELSLKD